MVKREGDSEEPLVHEDQIDDADYLKLDPDKVLIAYGTFAPYQVLTCALVSSASMLYASAMMLIPFLTEEPSNMSCKIYDHYSTVLSPIDKCNVLDLRVNKSVPCTELLERGATFFDYGNETKEKTLVTYFDLVCSASSMKEHAASLYLAGAMVGSTIMSASSDMIGRRYSYLIPLFIAVTAILASPFSPNYHTFLFLRFVTGFGLSGSTSVAYVMYSEVVCPAFREYGSIFSTLFWVFGYCWGGLSRQFSDDWRYSYSIMCIPSIIFIFNLLFLPDSLHWLVTNKKVKGIKSYIKTASRVNGRTIDIRACGSDSVLDETVCNDHLSQVKLIFTSPKLLFMFVVSCYLTTVLNLTYWALSLTSVTLSDDKWTGFYLSALIEWPAGIACITLLKLMKRKPMSILLFSLTSTSLIIASTVPQHLSGSSKQFVIIAMPLLAKLFNTCVWGSVALALNEMIPTIIRNTFNGWSFFVGDLGAVAAPYLGLLNAYHPHAANFLISTLCFIAIFCITTMPETKGKHLGAGMESFEEGPFLNRLYRLFGKTRAGQMRYNSGLVATNEVDDEMQEKNKASPIIIAN